MRVQNDIDRFHLVKDVLLRLPQPAKRGAYLYQKMSDKLVQHQQHISPSTVRICRSPRVEMEIMEN